MPPLSLKQQKTGQFLVQNILCLKTPYFCKKDFELIS